MPLEFAVMRDPRAAEAERLAAEVRAGHSLVLVGPAGIGKTSLTRAIAEELEPDGPVVAVRGCRSALDVPLGAYEAVLPPGVQHAREAIAYLRDRLSAGTTVIVDDAHDLDDASAFVTLALASTPGVVLVTCRRPDSVLPGAIESLEREGMVRPVEIAPLDEEGVTLMAGGLLGGTLAPATASRLAVLSGGNPLFVSELVAAGLRSGALEEQAGRWHWVGPWRSTVRLVGLVEERLDTLEPPQRETLELVALSEPVILPDLRAACETVTVLDDLEILERLGLVFVDPDSNELRTSHPLYGEVLRHALPRARLHRHALVLSRLPAHDRPELVVRAVRWKLEAGVEVSGAELLNAARIAHHFEDFRTTVLFTRRAVAAGERVVGGWLLGVSLEEAGLVKEAEAALLEASRHARTDEEILLVGLGRAELAISHGEHAGTAYAILDDLAARVPSAHVAIEAQRALNASMTGDPEAALRIAAPLLEGNDDTLARVGVPTVLALTVAGRAREAVALARRAAEARAELDDDDALAREALFAVALAFALVDAGESNDALAIANQWYGAAHRAGATRGEAWFALTHGVARMALGHTVDAAVWYEDAAVRFTGLGTPAARWAWAGAGLAAAFRGDAERAATFIARVDEFGPTCWRFLDPLVTRARAWQFATAGDVDHAHLVLEKGADDAELRGLHALAAVLAEDLARLGAADAAATRLAALADRIDNPRAPHWAAHANALAAGDPDAMLAAARGLERVEAVAEATDATAQAAALYWARNDIAAATRAAAAARAYAVRAQDIETTAIRALATIPPLTDRQVEIAALAAEGLASREIANKLVVSVRTVDNHLARVFRTFGISTRAELGEILRAWRPDALELHDRRATA
jgi:DNA-binding CsgD family transcriptional regulator